MRVKALLSSDDIDVAHQIEAIRTASTGAWANTRRLINWLMSLPMPITAAILVIGPATKVLSLSETVSWSTYAILAYIPLMAISYGLELLVTDSKDASSIGIPASLTLTDEALIISADIGKIQINWSSISLIQNDGRRIIVFTEPRGTFVISDQRFEQRVLFDDFHAELVARRTASGGLASTDSNS